MKKQIKIIDETTRTVEKIHKKYFFGHEKSKRLRESLRNNQLLENYFVFEISAESNGSTAAAANETILEKYELISNHSKDAMIVKTSTHSINNSKKDKTASTDLEAHHGRICNNIKQSDRTCVDVSLNQIFENTSTEDQFLTDCLKIVTSIDENYTENEKLLIALLLIQQSLK